MMHGGLARLGMRHGMLAKAALATGGLTIFIFSVVSAPAHIVTEEPWNPVAASYRTMMFMGDLSPVPWGKIEEAFEAPLPAAVENRSAREKLIELEGAGGPAAAKTTAEAIEAEDRQALYAAATRAVSQAIRHQLELAAGTLGKPGTAMRHLEEAQALYRSFADFIAEVDPESYRRLGRAWLKLTSSIGSAGVMGSGSQPADREGFSAARDEIEAYLKANYEPEQFTERERLTPLPETVVASGAEIEVAPWLPPGSNLNDQDPLPLLFLNFEEQGLDEADLPLVAYGDMLFDSPEIFGDPARSLGLACSTCHNRSDINQSFFIPGVSHQAGAVDVDGSFFNPRFNDRRDDSIDIPSLRGLRFTGPYGRDGRMASLRDFTRNVIVNEFGGDEPTPFMLDALVAYLTEFDFLPNSKLTGDGRLTGDVSEAALRGEELFRKPFEQMDGKSCASCHVPSASFLDRQAHNIGSGSGGYEYSRDAAYDTPTLLGAKFTAPYFHDGSLPTLASVVDWFDNRYELSLSETERKDLTAYLETVGGADQAYEEFDEKNTPFRLDFEELTTFATTLNTLLPSRDAFHAKLMIDTVAADLAADASGMANLAHKDKVYEMAAILADVGEAIDADDWEEAERLWTTFKEKGEEYDASMF